MPLLLPSRLSLAATLHCPQHCAALACTTGIRNLLLHMVRTMCSMLATAHVYTARSHSRPLPSIIQGTTTPRKHVLNSNHHLADTHTHTEPPEMCHA